MAVLTAYTRELGQSCGAPADYCGPMAKPHRMALVTVAALAAAVEQILAGSALVLTLALWGLAIGAGLTALRRASRIVTILRQSGSN